MGHRAAPGVPFAPFGMNSRLFHKAAIVGIAVLAFGSASVGTWATFAASTSNDATFRTGTILLSNQVGAATTCVSTSGSTIVENDRDCDALFPVAVRAPGDTATADVTRGNIFRTVEIPSSNTAGIAALTGLFNDPTQFYVNMHTTVNPGGVIRGQLSRDEYAFFNLMTQA